MLKVSPLRGFNRVPQPANMINTLTQALAGQSTGWVNISIRQVIDQSYNPGPPSLVEFIRLRLQTTGSGNVISNMFVGPAVAANLAAVQAGNLNAKQLYPITINGNPSLNLPGGALVVTDIAKILWDKKTPLLFSWFMPGTNNVANVTGTSLPAFFWFSSVADYSSFRTVPWTDFSPTGQAPNPLMLVSYIDLGAGQ